MTPAPEFDLMSPQVRANPYPLYEYLRNHATLYFHEPWDTWFIVQYDACTTVLKSPVFGREITRVLTREGQGLAPEPPPDVAHLVQTQSAWMLLKDPPDHTRLRGMVHKAFTPRTVERLREAVQRMVNTALDQALQSDEFDLIDTIAYPIPVRVIAELLDIPEADRPLFTGWSQDITPSLDFDDRREVYVQASSATASFYAYLQDLTAERRQHSGDDLLSALIAAEAEDQRLSEHELISTAMLLLVAGHETTVNLIGNGMLALMRHRDQWDRLTADPALAKSAIEELLRYDSPVQLTARYVLEDTEILGVPMRIGQQVSTVLAAANRDPARFPYPQRLDITRDATGHLAFGSGIHYCVGAPLARLEGQIVFETLARRAPGLRLGSAVPEYRPTLTLRGLKSLRLRVH